MPVGAQFATYPSLRDRCVLVTGGASGIGEAIVEAFAEQGARVAVLDVQQDPARKLIERLETRGFRAPIYESCDLTNIDALRSAVERVEQHFPTIDVLVNNAGDDLRHSIEDVTSEFWDRSMAVNLKQQFFMAQAVLPAMRRAAAGSIINMSSISWVIPSIGLPVYVTAKAAIVGMTRTLAHEVGRNGIRVK